MKKLAGRQHAWEQGAAPLLSASLKLNRVREVAAHVSLWGNQGRASTSVDIGGSKKNRCFRIVQQAEDFGTFESGRKAPSLEGFLQAFVMNAVETLLELMVDRVKGQVEIRGLFEDLGKKIDDLAGRAAALEEEVGELRVAVEENKEQIRYLKEGETGVMAKMESLENNLRRNNLRFLRVLEGLEEGDLKGFMARLIKQEEIVTEVKEVKKDVRKLRQQVDSLEQTQDACEEDLDYHRHKLFVLQDKNLELQYHLEDLKNQSQRSL
ncbi:hypothetical protein NDU88_006238 [Pleurodeles waltl]|uniref:Uncharacterized protein n=1 Tax=Pleurodeles waltl TaxID=8319 RepID=A0AAV7PI89_PLEWA|nr:hypothetical protein NDU88_006238 [Pleurodeles waltl]